MPYQDKEKRKEYKRNWNKAYYQKNREYEQERVKKRKGEIGKWFAEYKATIFCIRCGEHEVVCLDFHHKDSKTKDFNLGEIKTWGWGKERIKNELKKCVVLCANCHRKVHAGVVSLKS